MMRSMTVTVGVMAGLPQPQHESLSAGPERTATINNKFGLSMTATESKRTFVHRREQASVALPLRR